MSKKKATHCTKCRDKFFCGEEFIDSKEWSLCWDCYAILNEDELAKEYETTKIVTGSYVNYMLHNLLYGKAIRHKYGKKVIAWAKKNCPLDLIELNYAYTEWQEGHNLDSLGEVIISLSLKIAKEMNDV